MSAPRVGLLGGSFDPPHLAHLALARCARDTLALDELRWLPAREPWQKSGRMVAAGEHRAAMVRVLIAGEPRFALDERELHRPGPTRTIDTVRELAVERPGTDWFLVVGQDQYARFDTWLEWRELLERVTLAVASRAGAPVAPPPALADVAHRLVALAMPSMNIAATAIRARCAAGEAIASWVGDAVARYIDSHALYTGHIRS